MFLFTADDFFQVVLNLLDLEEGTLEHPQEGQFFICNLNTSQIVLHNNCVKLSQSPFFKVRVLLYQFSLGHTNKIT